MRKRISFIVFASALLGVIGFPPPGKAADGTEAGEEPGLLIVDRAALAEAERRAEADDPAVAPAMERLIREADEALDAGPFSVVDKPFTPPSGDKHDYMSVGPYWWPDPDQPDGLPYIRRDGETNPERYEYDSTTMRDMIRAVTALAYAYHFTGDEPYADHAAQLLRTWFLDDATRMNPHLEYGQAIPGRTEGRFIGIIDTHSLIDLLDPIRLLAASPAWSENDAAGMRKWFSAYLQWLLESDHGKRESRHPNNHGTWYDAQVVAFALFAGDRETARSVLEAVGEKRIAEHIEPDGSQPPELGRTRAFDYSIFNLLALLDLAALGERAGVDLWGYETEDGRSIRQALEWLAPYASGEETIPYKQIRDPNLRGAGEVYRRAGVAYDEPRFLRVAERALEDSDPSIRLNLLHPPPGE